jgi:hypothetical protein
VHASQPRPLPCGDHLLAISEPSTPRDAGVANPEAADAVLAMALTKVSIAAATVGCRRPRALEPVAGGPRRALQNRQEEDPDFERGPTRARKPLAHLGAALEATGTELLNIEGRAVRITLKRGECNAAASVFNTPPRGNWHLLSYDQCCAGRPEHRSA